MGIKQQLLTHSLYFLCGTFKMTNIAESGIKHQKSINQSK
jgi:hypothetical protein